MRFQFPTWFVVAAALTVCPSCTTSLIARKVPLEQRLAGADVDVKGFRYYLPRPYLVVNAPIDVATTQQQGHILQSTTNQLTLPQYVIEVPASVPEFLDLTGEPIPSQNFSRDNYRELRESEDAALAEPLLRLSAVSIEPEAAAAATSPAESLDGAADANGRGGGGGFQGRKEKESEEGGKLSMLISGKEIEKMQVVFLPDFEEQMTVRHRNFLSISRIGLRFRDGWQLDGVAAKIDSTPVPVAILSALQSMLPAGQSPSFGPGGNGAADNRLENNASAVQSFHAEGGGKVRVVVTRRLYLEPGVYRLNRASEMDLACQSSAEGLLTRLGIPLQTETQVRLAKPKK